jgi:FAD synthase
MKKEILKFNVDQLLQHPFHQSVYGTTPDDFLEGSIIRTGNEPVYPIVVVPMNKPELPNYNWLISGWTRLNTLKQLGVKEVVVIFIDITDETEIKNLIIDLNTQRIKTGPVIKMEFRHHCEMYPEQSGIPGNRYSKIGKGNGSFQRLYQEYGHVGQLLSRSG